MKKLNKKGFTLIELLAVIVILALLVAVAIPAVTKYLNTSRKGVFADNAAAAISAVRNDVISTGITSTKNGGTVGTETETVGDETKIYKTKIYTLTQVNEFLEKTITNSPFGGKFDLENSKVKVVEKGDKYEYSIYLKDDNYCIGTSKTYEIEANVNDDAVKACSTTTAE